VGARFARMILLTLVEGCPSVRNVLLIAQPGGSLGQYLVNAIVVMCLVVLVVYHVKWGNMV